MLTFYLIGFKLCIELRALLLERVVWKVWVFPGLAIGPLSFSTQSELSLDTPGNVTGLKGRNNLSGDV